MHGWQFRRRPAIFVLRAGASRKPIWGGKSSAIDAFVWGRTVTASERRKTDAKHFIALKRELNQDQILALTELEKFGWELKFIRRPMFKDPIPVVFDSDRRHFAILKADGTLDENPGFDIRKNGN
jgi:hypothetical protein